ncbi:MAG: hypothetical protein WD070_09235 [Pirellulaceae bacterium]
MPTIGIDELTRPAGLGHITGRRIVVLGGGESAVDYASRLARRELANEVFLSLVSGMGRFVARLVAHAIGPGDHHALPLASPA